MRIKGAVAIITGGSLGIGRAISSALLDLGARVSILDINSDEGTNLQKLFQEKHGDGRALFLKCDVTNPKQLEGAFADTSKIFGKIDIICNNAGIANEENWEKCVDVNLNAVIRGTFLGLKYIRNKNPADGGCIINVSSAAGLFPHHLLPVYSATKVAVVGFTRCFKELDKIENIRVTSLCPFFTKTPLVEEQLRSFSDPEAMKKQFGIDKFGLMTPEYVAEGAVKLIEDEDNAGKALYVTPFSGKSYFDFDGKAGKDKKSKL